MMAEIVNIVTSGTLGQRVDLMGLSKALDSFVYDPEGYHGGYLGLRRYTATVYSSGKYIIPGVRSFADIDANHSEMRGLLQGVIDTSRMGRAEVRNIVACSSVSRELDLGTLFLELSSCTDYEVTYEPEVFPGLCVRTRIGSSIIYRNGKFLLLGAASAGQLERLEGLVRSLIGRPVRSISRRTPSALL